MSIQNNISVAANNNDKIQPGQLGISPQYNIYDLGKAVGNCLK